MSSEQADYMRTERALGSVIMAPGAMADPLRDAFCALVGSKFAAVVAGGQGADWLIGYCESLVKAHMELPEVCRESVMAARSSAGQRTSAATSWCMEQRL
jgi:hypothetical protein